MSGPGTETENVNRAGTVTERESGREKGRERGNEGGTERESTIGHQTNQWTLILRYLRSDLSPKYQCYKTKSTPQCPFTKTFITYKLLLLLLFLFSHIVAFCW